MGAKKAAAAPVEALLTSHHKTLVHHRHLLGPLRAAAVMEAAASLHLLEALLTSHHKTLTRHRLLHRARRLQVARLVQEDRFLLNR